MNILSKIENNIKTLIEGMTVSDGYNYNWGTVNIIDEVKQDSYPTALVKLHDIESIDDIGGGNGNSYAMRARFEIIIKAKLTDETTTPLYDIHDAQYKAYDDLLKLFGNNPSLCVDSVPACHYVNPDSVESREEHETGDIFRPSDFITRWYIYYEQLRTDPEVLI